MECCCICLESLELPVITPCGHRFCYLCLKGVKIQVQEAEEEEDEKQKQNGDDVVSCPLCRHPLSKFNIESATLAMNPTEFDRVLGLRAFAWGYSGLGGWWLYNDRTGDLIENQYQKWIETKNTNDAELTIFISGEPYRIDFNANTQTNTLNKRRGIARFTLPLPPGIHIKGVSGLKVPF